MNPPVEPEQTLHRALASVKSLVSPPSEPKHPIREDEFAPACQFITQLVTQASQYGTSLVRLHDFMSHLPQLFGFHGLMLPLRPSSSLNSGGQMMHDSSRIIVRQPPDRSIWRNCRRSASS